MTPPRTPSTPWLSWRWLLLFGLLAAFSLAGYLLSSRNAYRTGFPLDDAWIHQTYARNLAERGEWAFIPGQPSAGSTAPLWSGLLALGHLFGLGPYIWTYFLGWASLVGVAAAGAYAFRLLAPSHPAWAPWAGVLLIFEWHLVWAAGSGMETLLFAALVLLALAWVAGHRANWLGLGLLIGLSAWLRPDGVTLLGPAGLGLLLCEPTWKARLRAAGLLLLGFGLLFGPYLLFNQALAGAWWPNTFFAKQAEYAAHRRFPLGERFLQQAFLPLVGVGAALLPGFGLLLAGLLRGSPAFRQRRWSALAAAAWPVGYLFLYALRLPVVYQHGRYVIPAMPVFFVIGLAGLAGWVRPGAGSLARRVLGRVWLLSAALVLALFYLQGGAAYSADVAIIESEMVAAARWTAANTPPGSLVAAHDIGALGYFGERPLLDLAGLVSPEVIPFIRDEERLAAFLDEQGAAYLVTFPGWYPALVRQAGGELFCTRALYSPRQGGENMCVYAWAGR